MTIQHRKRYEEFLHAMQSGVAAKMKLDPSDVELKHLRVGINAAMRDFASIVDLFIRKGLLTEDEMDEAMMKGMEDEKRMYEDWLSQKTGKTITLR